MSLPVLICDDSALARKQMARSLPDDWDVEITFATNGQEGVDAIKAGQGDIVFLDLNMPVMDGYEVLQNICSQDLPAMVIVVSGDIQPEAKEKVMSFGALDFIKKPVGKEKITEILTQYGILTETKDVSREIDLQVDTRDAYQEVANVAMGQAADLLARLLKVFISLPIPNVNLLEVSELTMALKATEDTDTMSAVCQGYIGAGVAGEALILFHDSSFKDMASLMNYQGELDKHAELEVMMDVSNILIGAFLKGISEQLDMSFSQGHPVVMGQHCKVSDLIHANEGRWKKTLAIEINYVIEDHNIQCDLLMLFTEDSLDTLNKKLTYLLN